VYSSEGTERISTKFGTGDRNHMLSCEFHFGPSGCNVTTILKEAEINFASFLNEVDHHMK
jgi:hypothetical protein